MIQRALLIPSKFSYWTQLILITMVYFLAGKFGLSLAFVHTYASAIWPPTAIALTVMLIFGYRTWPAIFLGAFLVNWTTGGLVLVSIGIAIGNTLEAYVGTFYLKKFAAGRGAFNTAQNIFKFLFFVALASTTISATVGVTTLCVSGAGSWFQYGIIWLTWWLGDVVSNIILAPLLIIWLSKPWFRLKFRDAVELILILILTWVVSQIVFGGWLWPGENYPLEFLCIPLLLLAAFRFGCRGASISAFLVSCVATWGTLHGQGPFVIGSPNESLLLLQAFMGIASLFP